MILPDAMMLPRAGTIARLLWVGWTAFNRWEAVIKGDQIGRDTCARSQSGSPSLWLRDATCSFLNRPSQPLPHALSSLTRHSRLRLS
jgi:hypothetical protein